MCKPKQTAVNKTVMARKENNAIIEVHSLKMLDLKLIWKIVKITLSGQCSRVTGL